MQEYNNHFPPNHNISPPKRETLLHKEKPGWLAIAFLVVIPLLLGIILLAIFLTVPEIPPTLPNISTKCILSAEAKSSGFSQFVAKLQDVYYHEMHPEAISTRPGVTTEEVREYFLPYDPTPSKIKTKTQRAKTLLRELENIKFNETLLTLRERAAYYIARNFLRDNSWWSPWSQDYYTAGWMLGPDHFCSDPICYLVTYLWLALPHFAPHNISDARRLREILMKHNETADQYMENLRTGWKAGMVRDKVGCEDGLHALKYGLYEPITVKGAKGILETFNSTLKNGYFMHMSAADNRTWKELHEKDMGEYFIEHVMEYVGEPIHRILRFLEEEHVPRCVTPAISSGYGKLPVNFEYINGVPSSELTTQKLPDGTPLNGPDGYKALLSFHTTTLVTPEEIRKMGQDRLQEMYKEAVNIAKKYTFEDDEAKAISKFKDVILQSNQAFNSATFPAEESDDNAFVECRNDTLAKKNCPKRWEAMQKWLRSARESMAIIRPKLDEVFYFEGSKQSSPNCGITIAPYYIPSGSYHLYTTAMTHECSEHTASQLLPFFVPRFGPKYTEWTVTGHEQLPGHHLEVQGYNELFADKCGDPVAWLFHPNYFPGFTEGWAAYVEGQVLPRDTDLYANTDDRNVLLQKYGMIHYQILFALRAVVDVDINYYGKTQEDGMALYAQYVWHDGTHMTEMDTRLVMSLPGFVSSYLYGEIMIKNAREFAERELGPQFSLKDFHYQVLRFGEYPLDYLEKYIRFYVSCKKGVGMTTPGCIEALS